ncbi:glycosyltransferase [Propionibacterium sp.]|uniref:glycosyltransferase n=1 Tax=Propionibacterium sp. TaxID=1977903 RepID=UPI0039EB0DF9
MTTLGKGHNLSPDMPSSDHGMPTIDSRMADPQLLIRMGYGADAVNVERNSIPWCLEGTTLWIAASEPVGVSMEMAIRDELAEKNQDRVHFDNLGFLAASHETIAAAQRELREQLRVEASERLAEDHPRFSARDGLHSWQMAFPAILIALGGIGFLTGWQRMVIIFFAVGNVFFFANVGFKVAAACARPGRRIRDNRFRSAEARLVAESHPLTALPTPPEQNSTHHKQLDDEWPIYSILIPVYKEAGVLAQVIRSIGELDYPHDKLDVMVLLEETDTETIEAARTARPQPWVRLVIVPDGEPRTKPRACNYGLQLARGEYVVIYDAEDRPDSDQLKRALISFRQDALLREYGSSTKTLACVQASLNFYNPDYNVLTRMFSIEYAQWFDSMLTGLDVLNTPMPLGGTSNHFLRSALMEVGGWDPYNVTEDADLGLRLTASGYRVDMIRSTTWEEATPELVPWIKQRTRWIKGYLITSAINLRRPLRWVQRNGIRASIAMFGLIFGTPISFLLYPITLLFTAFAWLIGPVFPIWIPWPLLVFGMFNMIVMNLAMIISSGCAAWRRYNWRIAFFAVFLPIYWLLHSVAAWRAAIQLIYAPFQWEKTPHGLTEEYDDEIVDTHGLAHSARG